MDGFEFVFSLFGLLLGFSLVEVFGGFGRAIEIRLRRDRKAEAAGTRIGWLSPLLIFYGLLAALYFARSRRINMLVLILMIAEYPLGTLLGYLLA